MIMTVVNDDVHDASLMNNLKESLKDVTSASRNTRGLVFQNKLILCIENKGFKENHVKVVVKIISLTLEKYRDKQSRLYVLDFIGKFLRKCGVIAAKCLLLEMNAKAAMLSGIPPSYSNGSEALFILQWCKKITASSLLLGDERFFAIVVEVELLAYSVISALESFRSLRLMSKTTKTLCFGTTCEVMIKYLDVIVKLEKHQMEAIPFVGFIFQYLTKHKSVKLVKENVKKRLSEMFVTNCIQTKTPAPMAALKHIKPFLKYLTHDDFKDILPVIKKCLLRNPETILQAVGYLLTGLSIDLSLYVEELSKALSPHVGSQNAMLRLDTVAVVKEIAQQCSDTYTLHILFKQLLKVLEGSEGNLSLPEQRVSVYQALEEVSFVSGSRNDLQTVATEFFDCTFPLMLQETHEVTLLQALTTMKAWSKHFTVCLPKDFISSIKKGLNAKSSTPAIRANYFQLANEAIKGNMLEAGLELLENLLQATEKCVAHQVNSVYEMLAASTLVTRLSTLDNLPASKLESFWNNIRHPVKKPLLSTKFFASANKEQFHQLLKFTQMLFIHHTEKMNNENAKPWCGAILVILLQGDWEVNKLGKGLVKKVMAQGELKDFHKHLLEELRIYTMNVTDCQPTTIKRIFETYLLIALCIHGDSEDLLLDCLFDIHHPLLATYQENVLIHLCNAFGINTEKFLVAHQEKIMNIISDCKSLSKAHMYLCSSVLHNAPGTYAVRFVQLSIKNLSEPSIKQVTGHDYGVFLTPEGQVYDQSIYESAKATQAKQGNVKRESKAYSYKEQKIEQELREELKKKKPLGKVELTKKQQEQLDALIVQEKSVRQRLTDLHENVRKHTELLRICLVEAGGSAPLKVYYSQLINMFLELSTTVIAASLIVPLFLQLSHCLFPRDHHHLGEFIGSVILRHYQPPCKLPSGWISEDLTQQTERAVGTLHKFVSERNLYLMMAYTWKKPFTATVFSYLLPLLKIVLKDRGAVVKNKEAVRLKALQIIMAHAKLRLNVNDANADIDENGPKLLPLTEILNILSGVITSCVGHNKDVKLQQYAKTVFDEVCKCSSGAPGTTRPTLDEVNLLLSNILSQCSVLRNASLKGLLTMVNVLPTDNREVCDSLARRTMIARFDSDEINAELAQSLWDEAHLVVSGGMTCDLVEDVVHPLPGVRLASSMALVTALQEQSSLASVVIDTLLAMYEEQNKIPLPVIDNLGRVVSAPFIDPWESRQGIALALEKVAKYIPENKVEVVFQFFVPTAFGDRNEIVRKQMLDAALQCVNEFGQAHMQLLLGIFEDFLDSAPDSSAQDVIRQPVIILMGSLAKHLTKTDPKIKPIFSKLMAALATPSQQVQQAVANCLPPLCVAIKEEAGELVKGLLDQLLESESYGERRGAAFGLAGIAKGLGILSLKQHNIISMLNESIQDKKVWRHREGALFAFETLCTMLGRLFEPYVVHLLPHLLLCFGDGNQYVREAADVTAKAVMRNLSNHGVKLVLPSLLKALEEESWRTKTGSAELLGAMSFCAPKQLSSCLPSIVPRLTDVLTDSHLKVQKAGQQALRQIGGVIRNPEIQEISPIILDALADANKHTVGCLQALLNTSFVHFIDAPSLALIMPTLEKALQQRPTETKKMAAQILGNMYALTDPKDLSPYLTAVVPGLKKSLLDPSPEVRGVSSRALGAIVKGMGDDCYKDLMPWLLETLTSDISSVDRSGAAQGLAEVLHALGQERLDKLMPDVIATTMKVDLPPNIREGYLMLYIYLPSTFGDDFTGYIGSIIPAILKGLADESEYVRDTSLKAGQRIISMYSDSAIELLLPQLEAGLFDEHWRIRYSSVQLLGDLLFRLSGVTGKQSTVGDEDDNFGTAHSAQVILETLGQERRDRVFAGLYMGRSDVALNVRQSALHVWKVIVQNTAKMLREVLPTLFELLLGCLASQCYDKRQVAARTLGDLVRKLGERILPEIIPILETGLENEDGDKRQGVCIGLSEIMDSCSREMVGQFEDSLVTTVRKALLDPLEKVRHAASITFENLHNTIGHKALDGVLPHVFEKLEDDNLSEFALDGLKQVMAVKSRSVLPFLIPRLTSPPVNTKALSILASVAGESLIKHLERILPAIIQAVHLAEDKKAEFDGTKSLILSVDNEMGIRIIVDELTSASKNQNPGIRKVAADLLRVFFEDSRGDFSPYVQQMFRVLIQLMNDVDDDVTMAGSCALDALVKHLDPPEQLQHLSSLKQAIRFVKSEVRNNVLPGFCIPKKGVAPIIPMFKEGVLNGAQDVKEQTSLLIGDIIRLTSADALKPSVVHITGPLIRILGDRFNSSVKVAILDTLGLLLEKVGVMLKPFFAQLQTTFIKALNDPTFAVRQKATWTLSLLTKHHSRFDSLFAELRNGIKNNEDNAVRESILQALRKITMNAGGKMGDAIKDSLLETLIQLITSSEDGIRVNAGAALGALCHVLPDGNLQQLLKSSLIDVNQTLDWIVCHGRAVALSYALYHAPSRLFAVAGIDNIVDAAVKHSHNDRVPICTYGVHSLGHLLMYLEDAPNVGTMMLSIVSSSIRKNLLHVSSEVRVATLKTIKHVCKTSPNAVQFDTIRYFIPDFPALLRDRNTAVKSLAEITLAFVLQLHRNDALFDQCVITLTDCSNFLLEYKKTFAKLSDVVATDVDDYVYIT